MTRRRAGLVVTVVGMTLGIAVPSAPAQVPLPSSSTTTTRPPLTFTLPSTTVAPTTTTTAAVTSTSTTEVITEEPTEAATTTTTARQEPTTVTAPASTEAPATTTTFVPPSGLPAEGGGAGETEGDERGLLLDAGTGSPGVFVALSLGGGATAMAIMAAQWFRTRRDPWS